MSRRRERRVPRKLRPGWGVDGREYVPAEHCAAVDSPMHDNSTNNSPDYARTSGSYLVSAQVSYEPNASGSRRATILKYDSTTVVTTWSQSSSGHTTTGRAPDPEGDGRLYGS